MEGKPSVGRIAVDLILDGKLLPPHEYQRLWRLGIYRRMGQLGCVGKFCGLGIDRGLGKLVSLGHVRCVGIDGRMGQLVCMGQLSRMGFLGCVGQLGCLGFLGCVGQQHQRRKITSTTWGLGAFSQHGVCLSQSANVGE
jgi:hypothetical protein